MISLPQMGGCNWHILQEEMWLCRAVPYLENLRLHKGQWISLLSYSGIPQKKNKLAPLQERKMVDRFRMWAKGGEGGNGCFSFHRSRHDRHGKPDGGNGGRGGDVILECSASVWDFSNLQHHLNAKRGGNGVSKNKIGSRGADKVAQVPVGTVIHLVKGEIPRVVENHSIKTLHPWEIPCNLEADLTESNKNIGNSSHIVTGKTSDPLEREKSNDSFQVERHMLKPSTKRHATSDFSCRNTGLSSHSPSMRYGRHVEDAFSDFDESEIEYDESIGSDNGFSEFEIDYEEEEKEEEVIQYSVAELTEPGQKLIVAHGGDGGLGNVSLGKASKTYKKLKYREVTFNHETSGDEDESSLAAGLPGTETVLILELKSIADVGLVGMPNAGKSTLLGAISRAKPVVGHYAFTTLRPNIGNLNYEDFFSVTVADIPGIIKGAHENRGMGHAFLRHIERTKVLAYVVDLAASLDGRSGIPPWEQLRDLASELECHQEGLSDRPSLVVANKIDEAGAEAVYEELKRRVPNVPIYPVCAVLEEGIPELKTGLRMLVDGAESPRVKLDALVLD